jgi:hypothetical protein
MTVIVMGTMIVATLTLSEPLTGANAGVDLTDVFPTLQDASVPLLEPTCDERVLFGTLRDAEPPDDESLLEIEL